MGKASVIVMLCFALACSDENPILGHWEVDPSQSPPQGVVGLEMSGATELEFQEGQMVAGSSSLDVTYSVEGDRVTVLTLQGEGTVYEFVSEERDEMSVETPLGAIVFRRLE